MVSSLARSPARAEGKKIEAQQGFSALVACRPLTQSRRTNRSEKDWRMPPREWVMAKAQFAILFDQRFTRAQA